MSFGIRRHNCATTDHHWVMVGGRPCPKGRDGCSQPAYECSWCGELDWGEEGGPGDRDCADCDRLGATS